MTIEFDLTLFIKETQLQHGLRSEDYDRYHQYLSNRLATLRKQLHLSNEKKKFLHKEITASNANDARHLMILALYSERCWAEAESQQAKVQLKKEGNTEASKPVGGIPPTFQYRKRYNKAVKWCEKLSTVSAAVGSARLKEESKIYELEMRGRCAVSHSQFKTAKDNFVEARGKIFELIKKSSDHQRSILVMKLSEVDDRVIYCMQRLNEDISSYNPPRPASLLADGADENEGESLQHTIKWNNRQLILTNVKVKEALREMRNIPLADTKERVLDSHNAVPPGQMNKVLDLMDRRVNYLNDALAHARQDLRNASEGSPIKTELQLIVHYFLFQIASETFQRNLFLAEVYSRRYHATENVLQSATSSSASSSRSTKKKGEVPPSQYASPLEVVRLYGAASENVAEMELLPGVAGRDDVEEFGELCRAGKLLYLGEAWKVLGDLQTAVKCYNAALSLLKEPSTEVAKNLRDHAERSLFQQLAFTSLSSSTSAEISSYLIEATNEVGIATNIVPFPPSLQAVALKPVFVDIASTYVDYPL